MLLRSRRHIGIGIGVMLLASLAASPSATAQKASPSGELVKTFTIGAGTSAVGTVLTLSTGWSSLISKYAPFKAVVENSPTMKTKSQHITDGTIHAYTFSAQAPLDEYVGGSKTRLRVLTFSGFPASTTIAFCTTPDSGVKTVKDLKGKIVYAEYAPSPFLAKVADGALSVNGISRKDMKWLKFTSSTDAFREVKEKRAHAIFFPLGVGSIDMAASGNLFIIPFSPAEQNAIEKAAPAFYGHTIKKGDNGATQDTPVAASDLAIWISPKVSEATAYWAVQVLYEHLDEFHAIFPTAKGFNLENACKGWIVPYHPGAILYFKEKGIWGPEQDKKQAALLAAEKALFGDK